MAHSDTIARTRVHTTDFDQLCEAAQAWDQHYAQVSPGRFEGLLDLVQIEDREIFRESWGQTLHYRGAPPAGSVAMAFRLSGTGAVNWLGEDIGPDGVIMQAAGQEGDVIAQNWDCIVLAAPEAEILATISTLRHRTLTGHQLHGLGHLRPDAARMLRAFAINLIETAKRAASPDEIYAVSRQSDQFMRLLTLELTRDLGADIEARCPNKPSQIVRRATDLVMADPSSGIGLTELCSELNVSLRTLHYAFQHVTEMSPATWLRRIRLNRVHARLKELPPESTLIKRVAIENGFFHAGHFSNQYERLFGRLPSQTIAA